MSQNLLAQSTPPVSKVPALPPKTQWKIFGLGYPSVYKATSTEKAQSLEFLKKMGLQVIADHAAITKELIESKNSSEVDAIIIRSERLNQIANLKQRYTPVLSLLKYDIQSKCSLEVQSVVLKDRAKDILKDVKSAKVGFIENAITLSYARKSQKKKSDFKVFSDQKSLINALKTSQVDVIYDLTNVNYSDRRTNTRRTSGLGPYENGKFEKFPELLSISLSNLDIPCYVLAVSDKYIDYHDKIRDVFLNAQLKDAKISKIHFNNFGGFEKVIKVSPEKANEVAQFIQKYNKDEFPKQ